MPETVLMKSLEDDDDVLQVSSRLECLGVNPRFLEWVDDSLDGDMECLQGDDRNYKYIMPESPFIAINGNGFFHHKTFLMLRDLGRDVSYVHIDAHTDFNFSSTDISYLGFVNWISKLPNVPDISFLGVNPLSLYPVLSHDKQYSAYLHTDLQKFFSELEDSKHKLVAESLRGCDRFNLPSFDASNLRKKSVYVSVDLDVVKDFPSEWSRDGSTSLEKVVGWIGDIGSHRRIVGADICGYDSRLDSNGKGMDVLLEVYDALNGVMD